ncbi:MAG: hypothetical protein ABI920_04370 [Casimicrobiaceae bacterium]
MNDSHDSTPDRPAETGNRGARIAGLDVVEPDGHRPSGYVERDGVSVQHFINRYIRTRRRPVNRENRLIVQEAIAQYRGGYPARCAELESFLDNLLALDKTP